MFKSIYLVSNPYIELCKCHLLIYTLKLFKLFQPESSTQTPILYAWVSCDFTSGFLVHMRTWQAYVFFDLFA